MVSTQIMVPDYCLRSAKVFHLPQSCNDALGHFFAIQNICINSNPVIMEYNLLNKEGTTLSLEIV